MNKTALILQEDLILLKILEKLMLVNGYRCKAIRSLEELDFEDQLSNFDIFISDILFDGIAPLDFIFQVREIFRYKALVIVTNMGQRKVQKEILETSGATAFFAVPFDLKDMQEIIAP